MVIHMKPAPSTLALFALALVLPGCALQSEQPDPVATGRVTGIYREVRPSVLVATDLTEGDANQPLWVQVAFAHPLADGSTSATARTEPDQRLELGDMVALDMAKRGPAAGLLPRPTMVAAVIERFDRYASHDDERSVASQPARNSRVSILQQLEPYTAKP